MKKWFCLMLLMMMTALPMAGAQENAKRFEYIWFCDEDYIEVVQDGKWGLMNFGGEMLIPCEWESMYEPWGGYVPVVMDGRCGFVNLQGELVVPCIYDREQLLGDGWETPGFTVRGDRVAIRQDGVLSIFASDGRQLY